MKKTLFLILLSFIVSFCLSFVTLAYTLYPYGGSYSSPPLYKYYWNGITSISGINTSQEVANAVGRWNNTDNTKVWFYKTSTQSQSILDFHQDSHWDTNTLGETFMYNGNTRIYPKSSSTDWYWAKVVMTSNANWKDERNTFKYSNGSPNPNYYFSYVVAHEIGHALGLAHTNNNFELMYTDTTPFFADRIIGPTYLDANGVRAIYGPLN